MLDELKEILSSLYCQLGLTSEVVRLSQVIDELIMKEYKQEALELNIGDRVEVKTVKNLYNEHIQVGDTGTIIKFKDM